MNKQLSKLLILLIIIIALTSCNQNKNNSQKEKELADKEKELLVKENEILKKELDAKQKKDSENLAQAKDNSSNLTINLSCSPINYNPKILSGPDPNQIHTDWKNNEVGLSWSLSAKRKITNEKGIFLVGDLISPRGGVMQNGPFYVVFSEWSCSKQQ